MYVGVVVKADGGNSPENLVSRVVGYEYAPAPYDIAIGLVVYTLATGHMLLATRDVMHWQRVATYGYPLNAISGDISEKRINIRAHKGIVQRVLNEGDLPIGGSPKGYELNFLVGTGVSGAPLFIYEGRNDIAIGVCVGSTRTEEIDEVNEVVENQTVYRETKLRITEFGVAHDLISLHSWKPEILRGKTLLEATQPAQ